MTAYLKERLAAFQAKMNQSGVDGILITNLTNIYYLTGFSGTNATVFISSKRRIFVTDSRYILAAKTTVKDFDVINSRDALSEIAQIIAADGLKKLGFESDVTYSFYQQLGSVFAGTDLQPLTDFVEELRMIKDASEIAIIRQACQISDRAFLDVLDFIKPGQTTELDVANFLDFRMREYGASAVSFDTIAASGYRSSMPHGVASQKVIERGEALTLDFGCIYSHYVSDITRTVFIGHASDQQQEVYQTVLKANQTLIKEVKAGLEYHEYDKIARDVIEAADYGRYFTHGIGHGIGLEIHEQPLFSKTTSGKIQAGMALTDEPGIYLDDQFGVRIEDDLIITETGCDVLTHAPKDLMIL